MTIGHNVQVQVPRYYANFGFDNLLIAPTPVSAYDCEMSYIVQPDSSNLSAPREFLYTILF